MTKREIVLVPGGKTTGHSVNWWPVGHIQLHRYFIGSAHCFKNLI